MTRAANAEAAMTLGACRAAGLIRQSAGAEAFSYVPTLQQLGGTRQLPSINPSASVGLTQALTESQIPCRTSSPNSGPPPPILAPMLLPKSPKLYGSDHPVVPSNIKESAKQVADLQVISIGICLTTMLPDGRRLICSL
jgi:hypothetical protein